MGVHLAKVLLSGILMDTNILISFKKDDRILERKMTQFLKLSAI